MSYIKTFREVVDSFTGEFTVDELKERLFKTEDWNDGERERRFKDYLYNQAIYESNRCLEYVDGSHNLLRKRILAKKTIEMKRVPKFHLMTNKTITSLASSYFIGGPKVGTFQSSKFVEDEIMKILKYGIHTKEDVIKIIAWKMNKIDQKNSENSKSFIYIKGWEDCEKTFSGGVAYNKSYNVYSFDTFSEYIVKNLCKLEDEAKHMPKECFVELFKKAPICFGSVYIITIIFFLSHGEYPIYDRFAYMALKALDEGIAPCNPIIPLGFPSYKKINKEDDAQIQEYSSIIFGLYKKYIDLLEKHFSKNYKTDRNIDRSLWIYGHAFK